jgi:hypothetical protein
METSDAVALYGAALSSVLAVAQGLRSWRSRTKVSVAADLVHSPGESGYGTPVVVRRGRDVVHETVFVEFTARNLGGKPVQVLGIVVEELNEQAMTLNIHQVSSQGLPLVLEPGTMVESVIQKEHLDALRSCSFLGVVDGTGRRHGVPSAKVAALFEECWKLPTRVGVYQRRDDPTEKVVAFQATDPARLTTRPVRRRWFRNPRVLANRPRSVLETLLLKEQPRVGGGAPGGDSVGPALSSGEDEW